MICERCKKNEAQIHLIGIINGERNGMWLCEECAKSCIDIQMVAVKDDEKISVDNILDSFFEIMSKSNQKKEDIEKNLVCSNCKMTYMEFKNKRILGCSKCYEEFKNALDPIIFKFHLSKEHNGKIPRKICNKIKKDKKINMLKDELRMAIKMEAYENAAKIRDEIRVIEKTEGALEDGKLDQ